MVLLAVFMMFLPLDSPFVDATATAASVDDGMRLEVFVEVEGTPTAVLVRGVGAGNLEMPPVALADRGDGRWEGIVEVPVVENIRLGFEFIPVRGEALVSELHTLTDLGVDRAIFVGEPVPAAPVEEETPGTPGGRRWGWLGLAAGAAALAMVALWTASSGGSSGDDEEPEDQEPIEDEESSPIAD
jgi:hypothetical protein